jgi:uridine phosphorylase
LPLGSTVVVTAAEREDGTSHHYLPAEEVVRADAAVVEALASAAQQLGATPARGRAWTIDAPFRETAAAIARHRAAGVAVVEMEAAAIFAVAQVRGARAGLLVVVSDELFHPWNPGFHLPGNVDALSRAADATLVAAEQLIS